VVTNFGDLTQADGSGPAVVAALKEGYTLGPFAIRNTEIVGPKVGAELRKQAVYVTLYALGGMLLYIAFRFAGGGLLHIASSTWSWWNWFVGLFGVSLLLSGLVLLIMACLDWRSNGLLALISVVEFVASWFLRQFIQTWVDSSIFGLAAVLAVFHDVLITLGFFSLLHYEISLTVIAALLTLVGYSMNDTIVIFDRIRENSRLLRKQDFAEVVNKSINQTLSRTILTSGLTFLTVLVLFLMGGQVLRAFSFALVVGIVVGTYSSFGIAAPLVVAWNRWRGLGAAGTGAAAGNKSRTQDTPSGRLATAGRR
jgi:preprotein translocase subunit SecF